MASIGDDNNAFFHRSILHKRNKNNIRNIINEAGNHTDEEDKIRVEAEIISKRLLLQTLTLTFLASNSNPDNVLNEEKRNLLIDKVMTKEIKEVI